MDNTANPTTLTDSAASVFLSLPDELILMIVRFVAQKDLPNLRKCCRKLEQVTFDTFSTLFFDFRKVALDKVSLPKSVEISKHLKFALKTRRLAVAKYYSLWPRTSQEEEEGNHEFFMALTGVSQLTEALGNFFNLEHVSVEPSFDIPVDRPHVENDKTVAYILAITERVGLRLKALECREGVTPEAFVMPYAHPKISSLASIESLDICQDTSYEPAPELHEGDRYFPCLLTDLQSLHLSTSCDEGAGTLSGFFEWLSKGQTLLQRDRTLLKLSWRGHDDYLPNLLPPTLCKLTVLTLDLIDLSVGAMLSLLSCTPLLQTFMITRVVLHESNFTYNGKDYRPGTCHDMLFILAHHYRAPHLITKFKLEWLTRVLDDDEDHELAEIWFGENDSRTFLAPDPPGSGPNSDGGPSNTYITDAPLSNWFQELAEKAELV